MVASATRMNWKTVIGAQPQQVGGQKGDTGAPTVTPMVQSGMNPPPLQLCATIPVHCSEQVPGATQEAPRRTQEWVPGKQAHSACVIPSNADVVVDEVVVVMVEVVDVVVVVV